MESTAGRTFPARISLGASILLFAAKVIAWSITGSAALASDALESIVNVVAAGFALWALSLAETPADENHPYGHGKIEFLSAGFEGGLVLLAAVMIVLSGAWALVMGRVPANVDEGLAISVVAALCNLALGMWLVRKGRALDSLALEADGRHVLSDVWTTAGVVVGLGLVRFTGWAWLDGTTAILVGLVLAINAFHVVRTAAGGLMDEQDPELLKRLVDAFEAVKPDGVTGMHHVRAIRSGTRTHVDAHIYVPADWTVVQAHAAVASLERAIKERCHLEGDIAIHLDPRGA